MKQRRLLFDIFNYYGMYLNRLQSNRRLRNVCCIQYGRTKHIVDTDKIKSYRIERNQIYYTVYILLIAMGNENQFYYRYNRYRKIQIKVLHITYKTNQIHCLESFYQEFVIHSIVISTFVCIYCIVIRTTKNV